MAQFWGEGQLFEHSKYIRFDKRCTPEAVQNSVKVRNA